MEKLEFKDMTILFDGAEISKKMIKKKTIQTNTACLCTVISLIALLCVLENFMNTLAIVLFCNAYIIGVGFIVVKVLYGKASKYFCFVDRMFKVKDIEAGWYNNEILLRVHKNEKTDYNLQNFFSCIDNEIEIVDKSQKGNLIHITVDLTNEDKVTVVIENKNS